MFEDRCKELRDELKKAREEVDRLHALLAEMVPRTELNTARKVGPAKFLLFAHDRSHTEAQH